MLSVFSLFGISISISLVTFCSYGQYKFLISHILIIAIIIANIPHHSAIIRPILFDNFFLKIHQTDANKNKNAEIIPKITHHLVITGNRLV
jgi:hypothetical protein